MGTAVRILGAKQATTIAVLVAMQVGSAWFFFGGAYRLGLGFRSEVSLATISVIAGLGLTGYCIALLLKSFRNAGPALKSEVRFYIDCVTLTFGVLLGLAPFWMSLWFALALYAQR